MALHSHLLTSFHGIRPNALRPSLASRGLCENSLGSAGGHQTLLQASITTEDAINTSRTVALRQIHPGFDTRLPQGFAEVFGRIHLVHGLVGFRQRGPLGPRFRHVYEGLVYDHGTARSNARLRAFGFRPLSLLLLKHHFREFCLQRKLCLSLPPLLRKVGFARAASSIVHGVSLTVLGHAVQLSGIVRSTLLHSHSLQDLLLLSLPCSVSPGIMQVQSKVMLLLIPILSHCLMLITCIKITASRLEVAGLLCIGIALGGFHPLLLRSQSILLLEKLLPHPRVQLIALLLLLRCVVRCPFGYGFAHFITVLLEHLSSLFLRIQVFAKQLDAARLDLRALHKIFESRFLCTLLE
mmetsp:Transcript_9402/g.22592  ORF Transcript_9402/g.22592 Transcript_9402/m.22592 type:complete len:353 (+) Transcript_9402:137-1195(+)